MTLIQNVYPQLVDDPQIDAFGRKRVSATGQRFDVEFIYDKQPLLMDEIIVGGATATHNSTTRDVTLDIVDTGNTTKAELIQHWNNPYTPGNSQLIDITGTLDSAAIGGGTASIFIQNNGVETEITQASWNGTNVDDVNWEYSQIFQIDFQSLKIGRLRFNLVRDGIPVNVHEIVNDNIRTHGYWQYPSLPLCWRIYNDATNTYMEMGYTDGTNGVGFRYTITKNANATMEAICGTVKSEGGESLFDIPGYNFSADNNSTPISVSTTLIPLLSIRPTANFNSLTNRSVIMPLGFELEISNSVHYEIYYRPTLTGASWTSVDSTYSGVEYDTSATAISGGVLELSGYASTARNVQRGEDGVLGRLILSQGFSGTSDILTVAAIRTGANNSNTFAAINWKEIR